VLPDSIQRFIRGRRGSQRIAEKAREVPIKRGGDSVFTLFLALDLGPSYSSGIASARFFSTPVTTKLSSIGLPALGPEGPDGVHPAEDKQALLAWIGRCLELTTYEISCPAARHPALAPPGKTGLIVELLDSPIFPGLAASVLDSFTSTPFTIERVTGNSEGAVTGWAFTNNLIPAVHKLPKVERAILTPVSNVLQAGQWTFSPTGLPISILTGKLAADGIVDDLGSRRSR
jgi:hypothetical protein